MNFKITVVQMNLIRLKNIWYKMANKIMLMKIKVWIIKNLWTNKRRYNQKIIMITTKINIFQIVLKNLSVNKINKIIKKHHFIQ